MHELIFCVVNDNQGSHVLKVAKEAGVKGGTIYFGYGTVQQHFLEILGLDNYRREIVMMGADIETAQQVTETLYKKLKLHKSHSGIVFSLPIGYFHVTGIKQNDKQNEEKAEVKDMAMSEFDAIFTIVDLGSAPDVIEASRKAGARGGTVIHARGSGIHETAMLFAMPIEPEKEIVLILSSREQTDKIIKKIRADMQLDKPGRGVLFTIPVTRAVGLHATV